MIVPVIEPIFTSHRDIWESLKSYYYKFKGVPEVGVLMERHKDFEPVNSALIAGALGVSKVLTDLAKAFLDDGKLTQEEVDAVFKRANKKSEGGK